jgi:pyruvate formate-lyase/glycerol dehydratase family glycyl radical enzyme
VNALTQLFVSPLVHSRPSARVERLNAAVRHAPTSVCLERPRLMREAQTSRRDATVLRRAKRLAYVLAHREPHIYADELIIGNMSSTRVATHFLPEHGNRNLMEDLERLEQRPIPLQQRAAEKLELMRLCVTGLRDNVGLRTLMRPGRLRHLSERLLPQRYFVNEGTGLSHQIPDYGLVVREGLQAVAQQAARGLAGETEHPQQRALFEAVEIVIEGIRTMATRLADTAAHEAKTARTPRAAELRRIAAACRRVPYEPARSFAEGLQAIWLVHVAMSLEGCEQGLSFGRLDQILWPLYEADLAAGVLDEADATELIACFYLKTCETMHAEQAITLGGVDAAGKDATNPLSGLFLDAFAQVRTREPKLQVRVHANTPTSLLERGAALVQLGTGQPAFYGDETIIPALERAGMRREDARDYGVIGCAALCCPGKTYNSSDAALFNLPLCVELALSGGRDLAGRRVGAATRKPERLETFDDVRRAFETQVAAAVEEMAVAIAWLERGNAEHRPMALSSALTHGCAERGLDITSGAADYDFTSIQCVGLADAGDALLAVQQLVFEQQRMSLSELVEILRVDFQGHEPLRVELARQFPKYGRGLIHADLMTQYVADVFSKAITARHNTRGGRWLPGFHAMTGNANLGQRTGALPNGRNAKTRLSNGHSPVDADSQVPTAVLRSVGRLDKHLWANGGALDFAFERGHVRGELGRRALTSLVRSFMVGGGGMQIRVNLLERTTLELVTASSLPTLETRRAAMVRW